MIYTSLFPISTICQNHLFPSTAIIIVILNIVVKYVPESPEDVEGHHRHPGEGGEKEEIHQNRYCSVREKRFRFSYLPYVTSSLRLRK